IIAMLLSGILSAQTKPSKNTGNHNSNASWAKNIPSEDVITWRRHLHQNPELSFNEKNTSKYVEEVLRSLPNIEVLNPAKTSVVGILKGSQPGRTIAFRADMDALPMQEET